MFRFNKKLYLWVTMAFVLASCAGREKHESSDVDYSSNAPFIVEQITKSENLESINFIERDGLKTTFIVNLSTCLKDSFKKDNSIQETPFIIEYEQKPSGKNDSEKKRIEVTSDVNGCIRWEEEYKYRYVIQPRWILLKRTIKKESGAYFGQVEIPLAVNPWLEVSDEKFPKILDLRTKYSEKYPVFRKHPYEKKGLEYLFKDEASTYPQLWAPEVGVQIETQLPEKRETITDIQSLLKNYQTICNNELKENCYRRYLKLSLTVPLKLRTYSLQKDLVDETVKGGSYNVSLQLLVIPDINKKAYRVHETICEENIHISNERDGNQRTKYINIACDIPVSYFSQHANYKLALQVEPNKEFPFTKFQGVYTINLLQEIKSGSLYTYSIDNDLDNYYKKLPVDVSIIKDMDIQYIYDAIQKNESNPLYEKEQLSKLGFHSVHLDVELKKTTFSNVENNENCSDNETVVKRKVRFIGKACIKDVLTDYRNKGINFRVFIEDMKTRTLKEVFSDTYNKMIPKADAEGCISWPDTIEHKNFNRQIYFPRKVHFLSEELNLYGFTSVAINPWQRAFQSYQDISQLSRNEVRTKTKGVDRTELVINQFKSVNLFPSYVLDKFLNIHLFHSLYFLFQPFITRHDNISLGKDSKARELLRDGYYILRILLLRNPQETGNSSRAVKTDQIEKLRQSVMFDRSSIDTQYIEGVVKGNTTGKYITHIDTIIKASANFVNIYMPLYFSKKQFFYLASRNLLSIQIIPVDPSGFKFKKLNDERTTCEIDFEKTDWKPFFNHDLVTQPYVGVFQVQNWTNWNILQPLGENFNTDKFIDSDSEGKKYRHFNLHPSSILQHGNIKPVISEYKENTCTSDENIDSEDFDIQSCTPSNVVERDTNISSVHDHYKERTKEFLEEKAERKNISSEDLIESFAERNSLKVIDLYEKEGSEFIKDLDVSHNKVLAVSDDHFLDQKIMDFISNEEVKEEIKKEVNLKLEENCHDTPLTGFLAKILTNNKYKKCLSETIEESISELIKKYDSNKKAKDFENLLDLEIEKSDFEKIVNYMLDQYPVPEKVFSPLIKRVAHHFEKIIDQGVSEDNREGVETLTFVKSLCGFWADAFFKKYLTAQEMRTSYTNYITKFDYYRILENNQLNDTTKGEFIVSFMNMIKGGEGEEGLKKCHTDYSKCILMDHCKMRDHSDTKPYCKRASNIEDRSCLGIVEKECENNFIASVCDAKVTVKTCHNTLNHFCNVNSNHRICQSYYSRCLTNYHSCTDSEEITKNFETSKNNMDLFKVENKKRFVDWTSQMYREQTERIIKAPVLESCLKDPYQFFQLESKMFIEDISDTPPRYVGGFAGNLAVNGNFSTGSYMNWTSQRGTALGIKHGVSLNLNGLINLTAADVNVSKNISSNISNSSRRAIDIRVGEGAFLVISRATFDINVKAFKKCLVIKPKHNAFFSKFVNGVWEAYDEDIWSSDFKKHPYKKILVSRPGLMICNPKKELKEQNYETIRESYYYISQAMVDPSNSQFLNLYDLANRPFMAILRGRKEFLNYFNGLKIIMEGEPGHLEKNAQYNTIPSSMFVEYPHPVDEAISFSLSRREFNETGFHPGVYTYAYSKDDFNREFVKENNNWIEGFFQSYEGLNYFLPLTPPPSAKIPIRDY